MKETNSEDVYKVDDAAMTTKEDYDPELKRQAYDMFLSSNLTATDIAIDTGVPHAVVTSWIRRGGWKERKQEIEDALMKNAEDSYRKLIIENRGPVVERHLRVSGKLEDAIEKHIDHEMLGEGVINDMKLKRLAEALSSVTGVSARAAAISDKPFIGEGGDEGKKERRPLVVIGVQAQVAPGFRSGEPVTINVNEED